VNLHNDHVLKWYRWQIFLARRMQRQFHETVLIEWHNEELQKQRGFVSVPAELMGT
jgi:hypothetical protein